MPVFVLNSATAATERHRGGVIVAGSHGGLYPAHLLALAGVRGAILNDAGRGLDSAGVAGLEMLSELGVAAATVSHDSARIGDGDDMMRHGILSAVNNVATRLGCYVGQTCAEAAAMLQTGDPPVKRPNPYRDARMLLRSGSPPVWGLDSIDLVEARDAGAIVVSGSHGGLIGSVRSAVKVDVQAAVYHDAGIGRDQAGISRLPALDLLGIAGVAVNGATARIGDARSVWETGLISACNRLAKCWGAEPKMTVQHFIDTAIERIKATAHG